MKATTIATKYPALSKVADKLTNCRPSILVDLRDLLRYGHVRPQTEAGHGRWSHLEDHRAEIQEALDACGIAVVKFNDAPRGGRTGDLWVLKDGWRDGELPDGSLGYKAVTASYATRVLNAAHLSVEFAHYVRAQAFKVEG